MNSPEFHVFDVLTGGDAADANLARQLPCSEVARNRRHDNHLKPRALTNISSEQIEQHWHLYEAYVKNTNDLIEEIETGDHGARDWGELKRRVGFEFNGMVLHEYYFGNLAAGATLSPVSELAAALAA